MMPAFMRTRSVQRGVWERDGQTGMGTKYGCTHQRKLPAGGEAVFSMWSGGVEQKKSETKVDTAWDSIFIQNRIGSTSSCWWKPEQWLHFREVIAWKGIKGNLARVS